MKCFLSYLKDNRWSKLFISLLQLTPVALASSANAASVSDTPLASLPETQADLPTFQKPVKPSQAEQALKNLPAPAPPETGTSVETIPRGSESVSKLAQNLQLEAPSTDGLLTPLPQDVNPDAGPPSIDPEVPSQQDLPTIDFNDSRPSKPERLEETPDTDSENCAIEVTEFQFTGHTAFTAEELARRIEIKKISLRSLDELVIPERDKAELILRKPRFISCLQLAQISIQVSQIYKQEGYSTSGAIVEIPQETEKNKKGPVVVRVIEGEIAKIEISPSIPQADSSETERATSPQFLRLHPDYVRSRLALAASKPLNIDRLQEALQLLQLDPLIEQVSATLMDGSELGKSILQVEIKEAPSFHSQVRLNNSRSPSIGSFQREVGFAEGNVLGLGDSLQVRYANTEGSNRVDLNYRVPINARNGTLGFSYSFANNNVIEPPFEPLNIESTASSYVLSLRQPIFQTVRERTFQEFAVGVTAALRSSKSSLLEIPFPLSPGADDRGRTRIFTLGFSQEWTRQNAKSVISLRSQFKWGLNALDSTIAQPIAEINEFIPDSRFLSWQGQAQWVQLFDSNDPYGLFLLRANMQLADRPLVSAEQFAIGGFGSVRGYRQDRLVTDSGVFISAEARLPILRLPQLEGVLQLIPFVDYGAGWNRSGRLAPDPNPSTLASVGLGLQWQQGNRLTARLEWGIPLVSVSSRNRTWQENGLYFNVQYSPF